MERFAILVRSNDGAEPFVHALDRAGVPFQLMALRGLYGVPRSRPLSFVAPRRLSRVFVGVAGDAARLLQPSV